MGTRAGAWLQWITPLLWGDTPTVVSTGMKNIFVGNLDPAVTEDEVRRLFQAYGDVGNVILVKDRDTGHSRGLAFVEMTNDKQTEAAINGLNGMLLGERQLVVNEARPRDTGINGQAPPERRKQAREALPTRAHRRHRY